MLEDSIIFNSESNFKKEESGFLFDLLLFKAMIF